MRESPNAELLKIALSAAVPLWILDLQKHSSPADVLERASRCGQIVAEKGDVIQFRSKKNGESAMAFNALAEGLACLAFSPGGVDFCGMHFEAKFPTEDPDCAERPA